MKTGNDTLSSMPLLEPAARSLPKTSTLPIQHGDPTSSTKTARILTEFEDKKINYFFGRLKRVYGANYKIRYVKTSDEDVAKGEWAQHIIPLGKAQIDAGFTQLRERMVQNPDRWRWPDIAGTIALCQPKPEDFGMPPAEQAWQEVEGHSHEPLEHNWSHRAVYIAGHYTGWFDLRNEHDRRQRRALKEKFRTEYQRVLMRKFMTGHVEPHQALEHHGVELSEVELSVVEKSQRHHEQQLRQAMQQQGINPNGGRREYLQGLKALGVLKGEKT